MSTEATPKAPLVSYAFDDASRAISRTDRNGTEVLATLVDKVLEYVSDEAKRKYHSPVARFLGEENLLFDSIAIKGKERDVPVENIPPPPKKTIQEGDKTPAYVEWLKKYKPKEYAVRYGIRGPGKVTKVRTEINPVNGRPRKVRYEIDAIIADRKTHLTELPDANTAQEDES